MTITTAIVLNALLAAAAVAALAAVVRLALRTPGSRRVETLHPSQPLPRWLVCGGDDDLARAA